MIQDHFSFSKNLKAKNSKQVQAYKMKVLENANKELDKIEDVIKDLEEVNSKE